MVDIADLRYRRLQMGDQAGIFRVLSYSGEGFYHVRCLLCGTEQELQRRSVIRERPHGCAHCQPATRPRRVVHRVTGEEYPSIAAAARANGLLPTNLGVQLAFGRSDILEFKEPKVSRSKKITS